MEQLALPFEEDLEAKAKRLFRILEDDRIARLGNNERRWWSLVWQDFRGLLQEGYDIRVYEKSDGSIGWDTYKRRINYEISIYSQRECDGEDDYVRGRDSEVG